MKNLAIILTLLAAFALTGCGSDEKASSPAKAPSSSSTAVTEQTTDKTAKTASDAPVKKDFVITKTVEKAMKEDNAKIIDQYTTEDGKGLITVMSNGKETYKIYGSARKTEIGNSGKDSKLGHFKPAN